jgi:hypothetical protein
MPGAGLERPGVLGSRTDRSGTAVHRRKSFQVRDGSGACSEPGIDERAVERGPWLVTDPGFGREPAAIGCAASQRDHGRDDGQRDQRHAAHGPRP